MTIRIKPLRELATGSKMATGFQIPIWEPALGWLPIFL